MQIAQVSGEEIIVQHVPEPEKNHELAFEFELTPDGYLKGNIHLISFTFSVTNINPNSYDSWDLV